MDKDSIKYKVRRETIMMLIFGIGVWIIIFFLFLFSGRQDKNWEKDERERIMRQEEQRQMVEEHLKKKYGERFIVEEKVHYTACAVNDLDFDFPVYVYSKSTGKKGGINNEKEVIDGYCWKFFKERIREELKNRTDKVIFQDYKLVILAECEMVFNNAVDRESSIDSYIESAKNGCPMSLYFIADHDDELLREQLYKVLEQYDTDFGNNMKFYVTAYKTRSQEDFISFDVKKIEMEDKWELRNTEEYLSNPPTWRTDLDKLFAINNFYYKD